MRQNEWQTSDAWIRSSLKTEEAQQAGDGDAYQRPCYKPVLVLTYS
jgi:hypothetical protein